MNCRVSNTIKLRPREYTFPQFFKRIKINNFIKKLNKIDYPSGFMKYKILNYLSTVDLINQNPSISDILLEFKLNNLINELIN